MTGFLATCCLFFVFWLSHRLYEVYLGVIAREDRQVWRRRPHDTRVKAPRHLGPKLFFLINLSISCGTIWALRTWLPFFLFENEATPIAIAECLLLGSGILGLWLVIEGRHIQEFYQRMIRSVRTLRRDRARLAFDDQIFGKEAVEPKRVFVVLTVAWAALPLALAVFDIHLISERSTLAEVAGWLAAYVVVPMFALATFFAMRLWQLRSTLYR